MRKILSSVSFCILIALVWASCSKKDITGTITPDKLSSTGTLAAGQPTHTIIQSTTTTTTGSTATTGTTANTTSATTSATTSGTTTSSTGSTTGNTTSSTPKGMYVSVNVNGYPFSLIDKDNATIAPGNAKFSTSRGEYFEVISTQFNDDAGARMVFTLGQLPMTNSTTLPTNTAFTDFFKVKDYNYSFDYYNDAAVYYIDGIGDAYNSVNANNLWSNSSFSVLSLKDTTYRDAGITRVAVKVKLKFNCTVVDDNGKKLNLTGGQATLLFANN